MAEHAPLTDNWRFKLFKIIYHSDTKLGKWFDILLILFIIISVLTVVLDSVQDFHGKFGDVLYFLEWFFTIAFTFEFILRLISIQHPLRYTLSFFGIVDILSILPTYLSLFLVGTQHLLVIRILRILRIFRILKLIKYTHQAEMLIIALKNSWHKIFVFLFCSNRFSHIWLAHVSDRRSGKWF